MNTDEIKKQIPETKEMVDELENFFYKALFGIPLENSTERKELDKLMKKHKNDTHAVLEAMASDLIQDIQVNFDLLGKSLGIRDVYIISNEVRRSPANNSIELQNIIVAMKDFIKVLEKAAKQRIKHYDYKKPEITFKDGLIYDESNRVKIHKFEEKDRAYFVCKFLCDNKKQGWIFWDEIAIPLFGILEETKLDEKYKKKIYDSVRGINKYAVEEIGQNIIDREGQEKYKLKF